MPLRGGQNYSARSRFAHLYTLSPSSSISAFIGTSGSKLDLGTTGSFLSHASSMPLWQAVCNRIHHKTIRGIDDWMLRDMGLLKTNYAKKGRPELAFEIVQMERTLVDKVVYGFHLLVPSIVIRAVSALGAIYFEPKYGVKSGLLELDGEFKFR